MQGLGAGHRWWVRIVDRLTWTRLTKVSVLASEDFAHADTETVRSRLGRMRNVAWALWLTVGAVAATTGAAAASGGACPHAEYPWRLPNSPYPVTASGPNSPAREVFTFNTSLLAPTQLMTLQTLQGALARIEVTLFQTGPSGDSKNIWLADLVDFYGVRVNDTLSGDFVGLLSHFASSVVGFVKAASPNSGDPGAQSITAALGLAAANSGWIVVMAGDVAAASAAGLTQVADATSLTPADVLAKYPLGGGALSDRVVNLQDPTKFAFLSDWAVFARAFTFFDSNGDLASPLSVAVLKQVHGLAAALGWGPTEGSTVNTLSAAGTYIHAADWANNIATLAGFYEACLAQNRNSSKPVAGAVSPKHTVAFLMTDGRALGRAFFICRGGSA